MKAFEPGSDEEIFESTEGQPVPYQVGVPCFNWYVDNEDSDVDGLGRGEETHPDI